ncbi:MAG: HU family DNA-binding protein [Candidatus Gastranaerophilaceae bacterium]|jgi:integration host factor subunit beta|nr:integration host factor subunit beta [Elusimicrobiaceae bacterium]MEE3350558.1 HU family DNA-binding protein [Candidatus Gastranaerophilaceae bacterium]
MNKKIVRADLAEDLYNSYSDKFGREEAARIIDHIILKMKNEVADGNTIELRGFGTLYAKKRNGRKNARNPKTGETKNIPPHYVAAFKAGRELKNALLVLDAMNS